MNAVVGRLRPKLAGRSRE